jgi:molecular chaperone DnaJ
MLRKSYYSTLGVAPNESAGGIRRAFHDIVRRYHPDRVGFPCLRFFQEIVEAYRVLSDPERRRDYDRGLLQTDVITPAPLLVESSPGDLPLTMSILRKLTIKDAPFEAALARVSGSLTTAGVRSKEHCEALNVTVILSPSEAVQGGIVLLAVPSCSPCHRCGGDGRDGVFPCARCDGEGLIEETELVRVHVLPLVGDGTAMNVPLRGLGVHNFYLRLNIRVAPASSPGAREATSRGTMRLSIG